MISATEARLRTCETQTSMTVQICDLRNAVQRNSQEQVALALQMISRIIDCAVLMAGTSLRFDCGLMGIVDIHMQLKIIEALEKEGYRVILRDISTLYISWQSL